MLSLLEVVVVGLTLLPLTTACKSRTTLIGHKAPILVKCYECGYGIAVDLAAFPRVFGDERLGSLLTRTNAAANRDTWCGRSTANGNTATNATVVTCEGACAIVRTSDMLTLVAGCAGVDGSSAVSV